MHVVHRCDHWNVNSACLYLTGIRAYNLYQVQVSLSVFCLPERFRQACWSVPYVCLSVFLFGCLSVPSLQATILQGLLSNLHTLLTSIIPRSLLFWVNIGQRSNHSRQALDLWSFHFSYFSFNCLIIVGIAPKMTVALWFTEVDSSPLSYWHM